MITIRLHTLTHTHSHPRPYLAADNNLVGELPDEIREFDELEILNVYQNELVGTLPETLRELTALMMLDAEKNQLTGNPFAAIGNLTALRNVRLSGNEFAGDLGGDSAIAKLTDLRELWIGEQLSSGEKRETTLLACGGGECVNTECSEEAALPKLSKYAKLTFHHCCSIRTYTGDNLFRGELPAAIGSLKELGTCSLRCKV